MLFCVVLVALTISAQATLGAYAPPKPAPTYAPPKPNPTYAPKPTPYAESSEEGTAPTEPSQEELDKGTKICLDAYVDCSGDATRVGINNGAQFCQCSNGRPYLQNCPPGTIFDDSMSLCNWPQTPAPPSAAPTYAPPAY